MKKRSISPSTVLSPVPAALVTCQDRGGRSNIITIAWTGVVCSDPPMVSISIRPSRYSHGIIKETGEDFYCAKYFPVAFIKDLN